MPKLPVFVLALLSPLAALPAAAQVNIATIQYERVTLASPQFKTSQQQIQAEFEARKRELEAEGRRLAEDIEKFQKESSLLAASDKAKREKDLATRKIDFEQKGRQAQEDFQRRDSELTGSLRKKVQEAIEAVAKEHGAEIVINNPVVSSPKYDISEEVLRKLGWTPAAAPAKP